MWLDSFSLLSLADHQTASGAGGGQEVGGSPCLVPPPWEDPCICVKMSPCSHWFLKTTDPTPQTDKSRGEGDTGEACTHFLPSSIVPSLRQLCVCPYTKAHLGMYLLQQRPWTRCALPRGPLSSASSPCRMEIAHFSWASGK